MNRPPLIGVDIDDTTAFWSETPPYPAYPAPGAADILHAWRNEGLVEIVYITSRKRERREITCGWLAEHGFPLPDRVLFEEDIPKGKPAALRALGAAALIDDMPGTAAAAANEGLLAFWRDIPKNNHMPRPEPHPNLHPWHDWTQLDKLVREKF
ncbi:MAG: hypothetical protein JJU05_15305 [Verrucomicrobia bacterium]|nr:hypothetical protein [Verrucomicrobiota bacterium]MCH8526756.1 hypothetical protein [Kiritimatiellia bacterium]